MVVRLLDPGQNAEYIQYETVRKTRRFYSNYGHACLGGSGVTFMFTDGAGGRVSNSASNNVWFQKFMTGMYRHMGDEWLHNQAISQYELTTCMDVLELK